MQQKYHIDKELSSDIWSEGHIGTAKDQFQIRTDFSLPTLRPVRVFRDQNGSAEERKGLNWNRNRNCLVVTLII